MKRRRNPIRPLDVILTRREQQVMEVLHRRGTATAAQVFDDLPDAPSYNAVRGILRLMEKKGYVRHERDGRRYVFAAVVSADRAGSAALRRVTRTFFDGSTAELINTLFDEGTLTDAELDRLQDRIDRERSAKERAR